MGRMLKFLTSLLTLIPFCMFALFISHGTLAKDASDLDAVIELRCGEYDLQGLLIEGVKDSPYPDSIEVYSGKKLIKRVRIKDMPSLQTQSYKDHFVRVRADVIETQVGSEDARARIVEFQGSVTERNATREGIRQIRDRPCK